MSATVAKEYVSKREPALKFMFAVFMTAAIAGIGWVMMTVSSSPTVKGASFMWLPAALQLIAGVWLGPWYGLLVGGIGAYASGIIAYGGWGALDITQNFVAGGVANAMLPAILFAAMKVDPTLGAKKPGDVLAGAVRMLILTVLVLAAGLLNSFLNWPGALAYALPLVVLIIGALVIFRGLELDRRSMVAAVFIAVVSCAVSAFIGVLGATFFAGKPFLSAIFDPGVGWFSGDTVSAILGLYLLALYTKRLRNSGIAD